jgi:hypothetical protein
LNGAVSLLAQREFVSGLATLDHYDTVIPALVDSFLHGVFHSVRKLNETPAPAKRAAKRGRPAANADAEEVSV